MKRPNLQLTEEIDLALTMVARQEKETKSEIAERALRAYLSTNYKEVYEMVNVLPRLVITGTYYNDMSIGYLEGTPVFVDDSGYLYKQEEGSQLQLDNAGGRWCVRVQDGKWESVHSTYFPDGQFDWINPVEDGPDYEPDDYVVVEK